MPWSHGSDGWEWSEPECSLGWQIADWAEDHFRVPGGPMYGQPLVLSGWQLRFLADWYAVDPSAQRWWKQGMPIPWLYRRGHARLAKKLGKSPLGGVIVAAEFCGPSVLDGFDASGDPVGVEHRAPWIQVAAVSEDQTANTYSPFFTMMSESDLPKALAVDVGVTKTVFRDRPKALVEVVTASAGSREGQPVTFAVADELQLWHPSNGGTKLYSTLRRNLAPMGGRLLGLCNAYELGMRSVAEAVESAARSTPDLLVYGPQYERNVDDLSDTAALLEALRWVYRDAPWTDPERIAKEAQDEDQLPEEVRRFFLNVPSAADSVLCEWPQMADDELRHRCPVAVGFDGSRTKDATALVAVHMVSGVAYLLAYWERPFGLPRGTPWEVPRAEVLAAVEETFARFQVVRMRADPSHWREELAGWQQRWSKDVVEAFNVSSLASTDAAVEALQEALRTGGVKLSSGDRTVLGRAESAFLRAHVARARVVRKLSGSIVRRQLAKPEDGGRIDCAVALMYAFDARLAALSKGWKPQAVQLPIRVR